MYVHVDIKKIMNKYKNISQKMSEYVGFSPPVPHPHTSYIYAVISDCCKTKQAKPSSVCRKYVGGGENPTYSLIFLEMFLYLYSMGQCILQCHASLHNIALFYYTLGNISPKYRSMLEGIQLLSVVKSSVMEKYGPDLVLQSFMHDLHLLEQVNKHYQRVR